MAPGSPASTSLPFPDSLLHDLLDISLTGVNVLRPVYDPAGEIEDFALEYVNPAGQRMTGLAERPGGTLLTRFPATLAAGILAYYRRAYADETAGPYDVNYQADGLDNYFRLAARRSGDWLVVSFTDTSDQDRSAVELALRDSQAREQALRSEAEEQRNSLRSFVEQAPVAVAVYRGPQHRVELANAATLAIWDRPLPDVLGRPVFEVLPEAATPEVVALFDRVYATGTAHTAHEQPTTLVRHGQRQEVYWNFVFQSEFLPDGRVIGIRSVGTDVTEQVRARQQLQQLNQDLETRVQARTQEAFILQADLLAAARRQADQQTLLYEVFAQTPAPIALLRGPGHRFEYVNAAYQALFSAGPLAGREVADAAPELAAQGFEALLDRVYHTGETYFGAEAPFAPVPVNGEPPRTLYFNFTYQAYRENEQIAGVSIFAFEVTEQVLARREREIQRQLLTDVFAQAPAGIWVVRGPDYVFEVINPTMTHVIKRTAEQCLGRPYFEVLPELTSQGVPELLRRVWEQGESLFVEEFAAQLDPQAPDEVGYFTFAFQPLRDEHGQVTRISCVALDVTAQVRARQQVDVLNQALQSTNAELSDSNQQLTRTNVDLDNFIYTASHDLKAPISNIEGLLYLLQEGLPPAVAQDEEVGPTLTRMHDAVERFTRTIDHLTDVSKLQKEHAPATTRVDLAAVIEDVRLDLAPLLEGAGAKLFVDVNALPPIQFSEKNLRSIVYNLLSNAVKYHSPDRPPRVDVRGHVREGHTVLEVHDNGLGIAEAQLPKLFGMFQRLHDHVEGTGIGLYMVKRMVENAGGRIEVHSQLGAGTTFFVFLPHDAPTAGALPFPAYLPS
ncbi:PAS domain-containing sensor histidine kinase [Hymenobacter norwichensis]|uniref:PAS domain-containing sensor histidine kinase n=1 Tax=Hymenobacter norwichensis TaxID=223903 RepID=UPI0003B4F0DA|nr:PAS domain-containing protein [Hymenobacter norwichensis]